MPTIKRLIARLFFMLSGPARSQVWDSGTWQGSERRANEELWL